MMSFRSRVITLAAFGFALGMFIGIVLTMVLVTRDMADGSLYFCVPEFTEAVGDPVKAFIIEALLSGLLGAVGMGGSAVYGLESWSILKATIVHFILTVIANFSVCYALKWLSPLDIPGNIIMLIIFIAVYVIIWLSNYFAARFRVSEINNELKALRSKHGTDTVF